MNKLKTAKTKLGNEIYLTGDENAKTLVIGVFHGDEPQGKYLIEEYLRKKMLSPSPQPSLAGTYPPLEGGSKSVISGWGYASHRYTDFVKLKAKELRTNATSPEKILWQYLRKSQFQGLKFRRQQPIGNYIVDFMCCYPKIIIELDGGQHNEMKEKIHDITRDNYLRAQGFQVIRIWNNDIYCNIEGVLKYIATNINPTPKSQISTLPHGEGRCPLGGGLGRGGLLYIPCLNPDGMQLGQRQNANGVDLNRNFPTENWQLTEKNNYYGGDKPASEIETQFVIDVIEQYRPETILTLHAPFKVVNYDGPAKELAEQISQIIDYPVQASIGYPTPGSFGTYAGVEKGIKTITLELDEECPVETLLEPVHGIFDLLL